MIHRLELLFVECHHVDMPTKLFNEMLIFFFSFSFCRYVILPIDLSVIAGMIFCRFILWAFG